MADKLTLPKAKFTHDLTAAPVDPTMKAAEATTTKLYRVPVDRIKPIPGFNVRVESPDYIAHRDNIRALIEANGYDQTKPLAGYVAKEGDENVIYVTDGHTRLAAVNEFNADPDTPEADEITVLPVLVHSKEVSLTDLTVALHTANSGRPLTPYELGIVVKRLLAEEGSSKKEIAARLGVTSRYLDDVLLLANADSKVKQSVASGSVSSTMAIGLLRKDADGAAEKIEAAVKKAASKGKAKATKKDTAPKTEKVKVQINYKVDQDMKEIVKAAAAAIREAIPSQIDDDTVLATVKGFVTIIVEVPAEEKKPVKKAPAKKAKPADEPEAEADKPKAKKAAPKKAKPAAKKSKSKDDLGIPGAEAADDSEIAQLPPKVESDEGAEVDI